MSFNYHLQVDDRSRKYSNQHRITIRPYQMVNGASLIKEQIKYEGHVYCVTVPSGKIVVRRNNKPCISGNSGKTSFSLAAMAAQAALFAGSDQKIVYAGNEESAARLQLRFVQTIVSKTRAQVANEVEYIEKKVIEKGIDNTHIFDEITTENQLIYLLDEYQPTILYIDDITNMEVTFKRKVEGVGYLEALFRWYRRLANKYDCAIIGVSQGVGDAEDKKWLKLSDIFGSRVPIQRALDYGIGIGRKVSDPTKENLRFIHVPKNKLHDGQGGKFTVNFQRETCKWEVI